jgi:uncharacterized protein (UPF0332 family)
VSPENESANAVAELRRAEESLRSAELLLREGLLSDAVSRAYYAGFHAVRALLFTVGQEPRTHRGALHLFNLHFIVPGKLEARHLAALARAQYDRTNADYGALVVFELAEATDGVTSARALFAAAQALVAPAL